MGGEPVHSKAFRYGTQLLEHYSTVPRFSVLHLFGNHEGLQNGVARMDAELALYLENAISDQALTFVLGDHGLHYGTYSQSAYGRVEHLNPALFLLAPLVHLTEDQLHNLYTNQNRLVTHYDLYSTIRSLLPPAHRRVAASEGLGVSILDSEVPKHRTCEAAGVDVEFCPMELSFDHSIDGFVAEWADLLLESLALHISSRLHQQHGSGACHVLHSSELRIQSGRAFPPVQRRVQVAAAGSPPLHQLMRVLVTATGIAVSEDGEMPFTFDGSWLLDTQDDALGSFEIRQGIRNGSGSVSFSDYVHAIDVKRRTAYAHEQCLLPPSEFCVCTAINGQHTILALQKLAPTPRSQQFLGLRNLS